MGQVLQVLIPDNLAAPLREAARRLSASEETFVIDAIEQAIARSGSGSGKRDYVAELAAMNGPTADIEELRAILDRRYGPLPE
jgi:hypothetical protein